MIEGEGGMIEGEVCRFSEPSNRYVENSRNHFEVRCLRRNNYVVAVVVMSCSCSWLFAFAVQIRFSIHLYI